MSPDSLELCCVIRVSRLVTSRRRDESRLPLASITRPSHRSRGTENEGLDGCYTKSGSP